MKTRILVLLTAAVVFSSCVSKKLYNELATRHADAVAENEALASENQKNLSEANKYRSLYEGLAAQMESVKKQAAADKAALDELKRQHAEAQEAYQKMLRGKEDLLDASSKQSREFLAELKAKQDSIAALEAELAKKQADLRARETRVAQLEGMIAQIQDKLSSIKNDLMKALVGYEGKGLTISQRDGKIYVSLENRLLFPSGSWQVNSEGRRAIEEITKVLVSQPDIRIMIEGHTDNVPYRGSGALKDNWDLSVMRATSIVKLITDNKAINPRNITAAGRSEYEPVLPNTNADNRARNRRTEVIITPDLSVIEKMLDELQID